MTRQRLWYYSPRPRIRPRARSPERLGVWSSASPLSVSTESVGDARAEAGRAARFDQEQQDERDGVPEPGGDRGAHPVPAGFGESGQDVGVPVEQARQAGHEERADDRAGRGAE